jgi:Sec-independent protein translocase protein TatA
MFKIIVYSFLFYLLYKFIVDLVIPVGKASSQVRKQMQEMQEQQAAQQRQNQQQTQASQRPPDKPGDKDYIEFEEVK